LLNLESNEQVNEYKGYSLFNDIEDEALRLRNRGVVLANMAEMGMSGTNIKHGATADIIGYFSNVPVEDRQEVLAVMTDALAERGIKVTDVVLN
jgi:hypothetical protein